MAAVVCHQTTPWVAQACTRYDQGAQCFTTAANIGIPIVGTATEKKFIEADHLVLDAKLGALLFPCWNVRKAIADRPHVSHECINALHAHDGLAHARHALNQHEQARNHWQHALDILTGLGIDDTDDKETTVAAIRTHLANAHQAH